MSLLKSVCISNVTTSAIRFRAPTARRTALKQRLGVYMMMYYGRLMLVSTLFSFYSIWAQRLTRLTTKSFSRNYIESAFNVTHIAGLSLTWPTERSASVSMTIFLAWFYRNIEFHRAVLWALSFSLCIMLMRMTPSYTLTSLAMILRSLSTEYACALLTWKRGWRHGTCY